MYYNAYEAGPPRRELSVEELRILSTMALDRHLDTLSANGVKVSSLGVEPVGSSGQEGITYHEPIGEDGIKRMVTVSFLKQPEYDAYIGGHQSQDIPLEDGRIMHRYRQVGEYVHRETVFDRNKLQDLLGQTYDTVMAWEEKDMDHVIFYPASEPVATEVAPAAGSALATAA